VRPDIVVEHISGLSIFSGESDRGREWLDRRNETVGYERIGRSIAVQDAHLARDLTAAASADGLDVLE
jgi:hypothetical protein